MSLQRGLRTACIGLSGLLAWGPGGSAGAGAPAVHVDPSRIDGCPGEGTEDSPYCNWRSVRYFDGGVRYLQRRGTTYRGMVRVQRRDPEGRDGVVHLGAYGTGDAPVIRVENELPDFRDGRLWVKTGTDVWRYLRPLPLGEGVSILLLDGRRAFGGARQASDLCTRWGSQIVEWGVEGSHLHLCSPAGNPATAFGSITGMFVFPGQPNAAVRIVGQRQVVIDGFSLQGGPHGAVSVRDGASDIEIRNSIIGYDSPVGVSVHATNRASRRLNIHDNILDSGIRWGQAGYEPVAAGEGILFSGGVEDSLVVRNRFVAWSHNGIYLLAKGDGPGVRHNRIADNEFHCGPGSAYFDYCRPFGVDAAGLGLAERNVFAGNFLHDFSVRVQVNGSHNVVVGNTCVRVVNSAAKSYPTGQCFSFQPYAMSAFNVLAHNTMYDTADVAVEIVAGGRLPVRGHVIANNILGECATAAKGRRRGVCLFIEADRSIGPVEVVNNLIHCSGGDATLWLRSRGRSDPDGYESAAPDRVAANREADPGFVDAGNGDFSLRADSPALGAAVDVEWPIAGMARRANLGAWEGQGRATVDVGPGRVQ